MAMALKYAVMVAALLPMMAAFPFVQKYFIKGVMIGALKE
jgi:putative aldouronate transport system permease protein